MKRFKLYVTRTIVESVEIEISAKSDSEARDRFAQSGPPEEGWSTLSEDVELAAVEEIEVEVEPSYYEPSDREMDEAADRYFTRKDK